MVVAQVHQHWVLLTPPRWGLGVLSCRVVSAPIDVPYGEGGLGTFRGGTSLHSWMRAVTCRTVRHIDTRTHEDAVRTHVNGHRRDYPRFLVTW